MAVSWAGWGLDPSGAAGAVLGDPGADSGGSAVVGCPVITGPADDPMSTVVSTEPIKFPFYGRFHKGSSRFRLERRFGYGIRFLGVGCHGLDYPDNAPPRLLSCPL